MKISYRARPAVWSSVVALFLGSVAVVFGFLWINSGGTVPLLSRSGYRVSFQVSDADNLVYYSDVRMAGVRVGKVVDVENTPGHATITLELDARVVPLHEGATVRVGAKSLVEESYVALRDGIGGPLPDGAALPPTSVATSVQLDEVLNSLDPSTRTALGSTVRSLGLGTQGRAGEVSELFTGLGALGHGGHTALHALNAQSRQLESLSSNLTTVLNALDTQRGQIATVVDVGQQITSAMADGRADLEATLRQTPGVLSSATTASDKLTELSSALAPVARDLSAAAPPLSAGLEQLPDTTSDLRAALSPLDGTLKRAPATLDEIPTFGGDVRQIVPPAQKLLSDLNPVLGYLRPYGHDIGAFFTNFGAGASQGNAEGKWARVSTVFSEQSLRGYPVSTNRGPLDRSNAYPAPGAGANPRPFTGTYPRVGREGK
jgi:phospholipid/cholesterol/gamma-HCH transport system substrate-binding protein